MITGRVTSIEAHQGGYMNVDKYGDFVSRHMVTSRGCIKLTIEVPVDDSNEKTLRDFYHQSRNEPVDLKLRGEYWGENEYWDEKDRQWRPKKSPTFNLDDVRAPTAAVVKDKPATEGDIW